MSLKFFKIGCIIALEMLFLTGCDFPQARYSEQKKKVIDNLAIKTGVAFPTNTVLISHSDGGGRDPSYEFYVWILHSPTPLKLPVTNVPSVKKDYVELPLSLVVDIFKTRTRKLFIRNARSAFTTEWEKYRYEFRATVLRTSDGDLLMIEQFRKRN